jgi:hypothetical protein
MSRAKALIEYMCPAPAVEPKPGVKPATAPGRPAPAPARPSTNPFRRRDIRPGEAPRPKAAMAQPTESLHEGKGFRSSEKASLPGKAKKMISGKSSGTGASGLTAKKAFKK